MTSDPARVSTLRIADVAFTIADARVTACLGPGVVVDEAQLPKAEARLVQFFDRTLFGPAERHAGGGLMFRSSRAS